MPPLKITNVDTGAVSLQRWLRTPSGFQPIKEVADTIFPTQEMLPFQDRWFYFNGAVAIPQNDFFQFTALCPADESWLISHIIVMHTSDANLEYGIFIEPRFLDVANGLTRVAFMEVENGSEQCLYPSETELSTVTRNDTYTYNGNRFRILPGERLVLRSSLVPEVGGSTGSITIRYKQVPAPSRPPQLSLTVPVIEAVT